MPYQIKRRGAKYEVVNTDTGEGHGPTTKAKAEKQLRLLKGIERGWTPTDRHGVYTREINGKKTTLRVVGGKSGTHKRRKSSA
jgi:hypothetical protein